MPKAEPGYEARKSLNLVYIGIGGRANPLPHHKDDTKEIFRWEGKSTTHHKSTTNLKVHLKKGEMKGSTKIQS